MCKLERRIKNHSGIFPKKIGEIGEWEKRKIPGDEQERKYLSPSSQNRKLGAEKAPVFHFSRCQRMNIAEN